MATAELRLVVSVALVLENNDSHLALRSGYLKNTAHAASPAFCWLQSVPYLRHSLSSRKSGAYCLGKGAGDWHSPSECKGELCCSWFAPALGLAEG